MERRIGVRPSLVQWRHCIFNGAVEGCLQQANVRGYNSVDADCGSAAFLTSLTAGKFIAF